MKLPWSLERKHYWALVGGLVTTLHSPRAQLWANAQADLWPAIHAVACSANGNRLISTRQSVDGFGNFEASPVYVSTDAGATWTDNGISNYWQAVASSADGTKLVAVSSIALFLPDPYTNIGGVSNPTPTPNESLVGDGQIYVSTNSGATWKPSGAPVNTWSGVASSADGTKLVATATRLQSGGPGLILSGDGRIYRSANSGLSWVPTSAPPDDWISVASSADGSKLVAAGSEQIYSSTDSGATWAATTAPSNNWTSVASSADGSRFIAAASNTRSGRIYLSSDSGQSWVPASAPSIGWSAVASSADGNQLLAASVDGAEIYISADSGLTWTATAAPRIGCSAIASSADGYRVIAGGGSLVTLPYLGPWRWVNAPSSNDWSAVAVSSDGTKLAAAPYLTDPGFGRSLVPGQIYTSANSGASWRATTAPPNEWSSITFSADGTTLLAAGIFDPTISPNLPSPGGLYVSTNSGTSWRGMGIGISWNSAVCSADGIRLAALRSDGLLYLSTNSGARWSTGINFPRSSFSAIASSADGSKLVVAGEQIYTSSDSGVTWTLTSAPSNNWWSVASSGDGTKLAAVGNEMNHAWGADGLLYVSLDSGATWAPSSTPTNVTLVTLSSDGLKLAAVGAGGNAIYISTNAGVSWTVSDTPAQGAWKALAISGDGSQLVTAGQGILTCPLPAPPPAGPRPPSPRLIIGRSGANPVLSWLVPSTGLVLQQSPDLNSPNWVEITNQPALNFTNLQNEVRLPPPADNTFYRDSSLGVPAQTLCFPGSCRQPGLSCNKARI
jgi:hypothetical protein